MPKGLNNWSFRQVVKFLKSFSFQETHVRGSHHYYSGFYNNLPRMVTVPNHKQIKTGTMKGIVSQSGVPEKLWRNSNK